ncbi:MAG: hypothetical protein NTY94_17150 [Alphaproteobacteria bacterium]|nr:hypothetical protein [Alphaproteobacteria bacterium]
MKQLTQRAGDILPLWISFEQSCGLAVRKGIPAEQAPAAVRDAMQDDVPARFKNLDGTTEDVTPEDRPRLMVALETGRAWLMGPPSDTLQTVTSPEPPPRWEGRDILTKTAPLGEHLDRLLSSQLGAQAQATRSRAGRPPHILQMVAFRAALLFLARHGIPSVQARLVEHMQEALAASDHEEPGERSLRTWAGEFCLFWQELEIEQYNWKK